MEKKIVNNYGSFDLTFVKGKNATMYSADGRKYIDFIAGIGVNCLGHNNRHLVKAIRKQASRQLHISNYYFSDKGLEFADRLLSANDPIMNATNPSSVKVGEIDRRLRTFQLNAYAVKALKARVALWKGDYQKALNNADSVMLHTDPARVATRYQLFYFVTPGKYGSDFCFSRENIFALSSLPTGFTRLSETLFDQKKVRCRADIDKIYAQQTDIRRRAWFREQADGTQIMSNKYGPNTLLTGYVSTESGGSTDLPAAIPYIRLGEVQLIAAESLWRLNRKQEARQRLIAMQSSKDVTYVADASEDADLLPMIYDEYRRDLFGDGQLYYLNKRISR